MVNAITSGKWVSVSTGLPRLVGIGTHQVNWGRYANRARRQSGYRFVGQTVPLHLDGKEFVLGTFTHNNFPIYSMRSNRFSANLLVSVVFDDGGLKRNFGFTFNHYETPNRGTPEQQADQVTLNSMRASETLEIDGEQFAVEIVGFKQNGQIVHQFISFE
ncbi:MAG: choice-of-anchor K domain-containing protein, partial [Nannocystaceae bacterium]